MLYNLILYMKSGAMEYLLSYELKDMKRLILDIPELCLDNNMNDNNSIFNEKTF